MARSRELGSAAPAHPRVPRAIGAGARLVWAACASAVWMIAASQPLAAQDAPTTPTTFVDRGVAAYEDGDFEAALGAFAQAEAGALDRALLVRILAHRVLISHASSDAPQLEQQALRLVSLEPDALRSEASPGLVRALEAARQRADGVIRLRIEHEVGAEGLRLRARVEGDVAGMVTQIRLRARRGDGAFVEASDGAVTLGGDSTEGVVFIADCVGPGGAVLAALGSDEQPEPLGAAVAEEILATGGGDDTALHVGLIVGGGVVAVAVAVLIGVLVADASAATGQLSGPVVEW